MPEASSGTYQAFGMLLSSSLALPELMPADAVPLAGCEPLVELVEADHRQWPTLQASPHSTPTLQLAPQEWRLELEGIGWFLDRDNLPLSQASRSMRELKLQPKNPIVPNTIIGINMRLVFD